MILLKVRTAMLVQFRSMNPLQSCLGPLALAIAMTCQAVSLHASDDTAKGRELAERLCKTCHLTPGQGEKQSASEIPGFYAIARRPNQDLEGIVEWLRSIPPMMPNHHLSQDEMFALAQFILSLRAEPQP